MKSTGKICSHAIAATFRFATVAAVAPSNPAIKKDKALKRSQSALATLFAALLAAMTLIASPSWALAPTTINGVQILSGGIGEGEESALRSAAEKFTLLIELSEMAKGETHGMWVANARVEITGPGGFSIVVPGAGPLVAADLAPGTYTVSAVLRGEKKQKSVKVIKGKLTKTGLFWIIGAPGK